MKLKEGTEDYPNKWWETDHRQKTKPRMIGGAFKQKKKERDSSDVHDLQRYIDLSKAIMARKNVKEEKEMSNEESNTSPGVETIELPDRYEGKYSVRNVYMKLDKDLLNVNESRNLPITDGQPGQHKPSKYKYLGVHKASGLHIFQEPGGPKEGFAKRKPGSGDASWHIKRGAHVYEFVSSHTVKEDVDKWEAGRGYKRETIAVHNKPGLNKRIENLKQKSKNGTITSAEREKLVYYVGEKKDKK